MMGCADACQQKFFNEYCLRISPVGTSVDLLAGGAFADAMENIRRRFYTDGQSPEEAIQKSFRDYIFFWGDYEEPEGHQKDFVNTWGAVEYYFAQYPLDTDPIQPCLNADGTYAIEYTFAIPTNVRHPVTGDLIIYAGRFDMLGTYMDMLAVIDEKTTKGIGTSWAYQWDMRGQFIGYTKVARDHGYNCKETLVRGIAIQKTQYKTAHMVITYPDWKMERWWEHMNIKLQKLIYIWEEMHDLYRTEEFWHNPWIESYGEACTSYGTCQFTGLCNTNPRERHRYYTDFSRRVWNPLIKNPSEGSVERVKKQETLEIDFDEFLSGG